MTTKDSLRKEIQNKRKEMPKNQVDILSKKICERLIDSPLYREAMSMFCYNSIRNEVDLSFLMEKAIADGKKVSLPKVLDKSGIMKFYAIDRLSGLKKGAYGIFEPDEKNEETTADLILVPGVVFSKNGDRIGQAGGFYDRYLKDYPIKSVGICYDYQIFEEIPTEDHDIKMHHIISEKRFININ